jgi:hypothetical protein
LVVVIVVILAFATIAVPNFTPARFDAASVALAVRVRVRDQNAGTPVGGATIQVPSFFDEAVTDANGQCEAIARFHTTGIVGRSANVHLHGTLKVSAPGYQDWESSFVSLFGPKFDYFNKGTAVRYTVFLVR